MANRITRAYDAHSKLSVAGVRLYDVDTIPSVDEALRNAPCIVPVFEFESGLVLPTATDGIGDQSFTARFLLLVAPALGTRGLYVVTPQTMRCIDAYYEAVAANPRLDGTLADDAEVTATAVIRNVGAEDDPASAWYAVAISHTWLFYTED